MNFTLSEWQVLKKPTEHCIVQASHIDGKDTWQPFPIGMGHHWLHYKDDPAIQIGSHEQLLYVAINPTSDKGRRGKTTIHRQSILGTLSKRGFYNQFTTPRDYFYTLPHYKFVASPEGNGIDCHRHMEAIFAGCIPIVEDKPEMREKYEGLPVLWTKDFSEITKLYLKAAYERMLIQSYNFSKLYIPSYTTEHQEQMKQSMNYWLTLLR